MAICEANWMHGWIQVSIQANTGNGNSNILRHHFMFNFSTVVCCLVSFEYDLKSKLLTPNVNKQK